MKENTHPKYYGDAKITCACGNNFRAGSTKPEIHVEICSKCHPFFTGAAKFIDTEGRVERFQRQQKEADSHKESISKKRQVEKPKKEQERPQSLKEMMALLKRRG